MNATLLSLRSTNSGLLCSIQPFVFASSIPGITTAFVRAYSSQASLQEIAARNERLKESFELFDANELPRALEIALQEYRMEFEAHDFDCILSSSKTADESARPAFTFLSSLLASLGPKHPETIKTIALMRSTHPEATPFKPRVIQKSHGGYPVRLNNGKWTWQGPHWSRHNNRTWKSGYSSDFTYGWGK